MTFLAEFAGPPMGGPVYLDLKHPERIFTQM